jgi:hypothetical protein
MTFAAAVACLIGFATIFLTFAWRRAVRVQDALRNKRSAQRARFTQQAAALHESSACREKLKIKQRFGRR